jgi:hypothetical protein
VWRLKLSILSPWVKHFDGGKRKLLNKMADLLLQHKKYEEFSVFSMVTMEKDLHLNAGKVKYHNKHSVHIIFAGSLAKIMDDPCSDSYLI